MRGHLKRGGGGMGMGMRACTATAVSACPHTNRDDDPAILTPRRQVGDLTRGFRLSLDERRLGLLETIVEARTA